MRGTQLKNFERKANRTPNLKNYGKEAIDDLGQVKAGYVRLRDNRVVKISEVVNPAPSTTLVVDAETIEAQAENFPDLFDCKNLAYTKDGKLKSGYFELKNKKVISLKKLNAAVTDAAKGTTVTTSEA
jgi:hypothetical protein